MENQELLQAIRDIISEEVKKSVQEELKPVKDQLEMLAIKQEVTKNHVEELTFQVAALRHDSKKEFKKLNDEMEKRIIEDYHRNE